MKGLFILSVSLFLVGCSALGLAPATTFDTRLANAYGVYTAVNQATTTAHDNGALSDADALAVQGLQKNSRTLLDTARSLEQSNPTGAQNNLTLALSALTAVQSYLNNHSGVKNGSTSRSEPGGGSLGSTVAERYASESVDSGRKGKRVRYA